MQPVGVAPANPQRSATGADGSDSARRWGGHGARHGKYRKSRVRDGPARGGAVTSRSMPATGGADAPPSERAYFSEVQGISHRALAVEATPLTFADSSRTSLSKIHGTAGA